MCELESNPHHKLMTMGWRQARTATAENMREPILGQAQRKAGARLGPPPAHLDNH